MAALAVCLLAFVLFGMTTDLRAESNQAGSKQAVLHINVVVMPLIQAPNMTTSPRHDGSVTFKLDTPPHEKHYEVRSLPRDASHSYKEAPAILQTVVIVPE